MDIFKCSIDFAYFVDPVTTRCGHTFCRDCYIRCVDAQESGSDYPKCPLCRDPLDPDPPAISIVVREAQAAALLGWQRLEAVFGVQSPTHPGGLRAFVMPKDPRGMLDFGAVVSP